MVRDLGVGAVTAPSPDLEGIFEYVDGKLYDVGLSTRGAIFFIPYYWDLSERIIRIPLPLIQGKIFV